MEKKKKKEAFFDSVKDEKRIKIVLKVIERIYG